MIFKMNKVEFHEFMISIEEKFQKCSNVTNENLYLLSQIKNKNKKNKTNEKKNTMNNRLY